MKIAAFTIDGNGTFAQDVPAFAAAITAAGADIILAPGTSRARRSLPAAAMRAGAAIDTNVVAVTTDGDKATVQRWAYRQRILTTFSRAARPWVIVTDPALFADICAGLGATPAPIPAGASAETRTKVNGVVAAGTGGESTIKPDSPLLFVAGAGWTKKQSDGATVVHEAPAHHVRLLAVAARRESLRVARRRARLAHLVHVAHERKRSRRLRHVHKRLGGSQRSAGLPEEPRYG